MQLFLSLSLMVSALLAEEAQAFTMPKRSFVHSTALFDQPSDAEAAAVETTSTTLQELGLENFEGSGHDEHHAHADSSFVEIHADPNAPKLQEMIFSQLRGAMTIYTFATARDFVRENKTTMVWERPELILTQAGTPDPDDPASRYLKNPVSLAAIYTFISHPDNWKNLKKCKDLNTDENDPTNICATLEPLQKDINADIVEFDDEFDTRSLVYAIILNRTKRTVSVVFRGSASKKDWTVDLRAAKETLGPRQNQIRVHKGFNRYLSAKPKHGSEKSKMDQIVKNIINLYEKDEYKDYAFYITGHSLGGALTQLLAYRLAAEGRLKDVIPVGTPITAVSFASPQVGNNAYNEAFSQFERESILRHIRVSNAGDVVPVAPVLRYTQTGLHLFLEEGEKEMEVGHRNLKRLSKETMHLMKWGDNHSTEEYWKRLAFEKNQVILERNTVENLHKKSTLQEPGLEDFDGTELDELQAHLQGGRSGRPISKCAVDPNAPKLQEMTFSHLHGSMAIYTFATVRDFVRKNKTTMTWERPEHILTQDACSEEEVFRYLKNPVSLAAIYTFISHPGNWENLKKCSDLNTNKEDPNNIRDFLEPLQKSVNADIVEFDDEFHTSSLVNAIILNRTKRTISVVFRGSVLEGMDWPTNLRAVYETGDPIKVPEESIELKKKIRVHKGFNTSSTFESISAYLSANPKRDGLFGEWLEKKLFKHSSAVNDKHDRDKSKIDQIVDNIAAVYKQDDGAYKDYGLCISGHSLGGALSQLLAYRLAAGDRLKDVLLDGAPITAISFASPQVGNDGYNEAFSYLERKGDLRHIRISNAGDMVPVAPFGAGYTQTGLHVFLKENKVAMEVGHRNLKNTWMQIRSKSALEKNHGLEEYHARMSVGENKLVFDSNTVEDLYSKYPVEWTQ